MANLARYTMFFEDGKYGWSETHWDMSGPDLKTVIADGLRLAKVRSKLLGAGVYMSGGRASYDDVFRDSLVHPGIDFPGGSKVYNSDFIGLPSDLPYSVTLLRAESGELYRKSIYLSGVPDFLQVDPPPGQYNASWLAAFKAYQQELINFWGFAVKNRDANVNPVKPITGISAANPTVFTVPNHGFVTGDDITIRGVFGTGPKQNGVRRVIGIDNNTFSVFGSTGGFFWAGGGTVQKRITVLRPYTAILLRGETHRKRGGPFDRPRGRSRKRSAR